MPSFALARQFAKSAVVKSIATALYVPGLRSLVPASVADYAGRRGADVHGILGTRLRGLPRPVDLPAIEQLLSVARQNVGSGALSKTSIIIPVFNKAELTRDCLRSLLSIVDVSTTEIIVVNNGSTDSTAELLTQCRDVIRVVDPGRNLGFVGGCNLGAAAANGGYLVFLNNDTILLPGWLDALVDTVERDTTIGAVGSMFIYPVGRLQEAGSIVWKDGSAHHYGGGASPLSRKFVFARDVDYCSGASLLVRRDLFNELGGFDERYAPGYYEDVDLCFGIRTLGKRVVFQPESRLVHYEGGTSGTDLATGMKKFQTINHKKFVSKWKPILETEQLPRSNANVERASDRKHSLPVVMVFDQKLPRPDRDAGSLRMLHILRSLQTWARVVFVPVFGAMESEYERWLTRDGIRVEGLPFWRKWRRENVRAVILSRPEVASRTFKDVRSYFPKAKIVYDMVDAHFVRLEREYQLTGDRNIRDQARAAKRAELTAARNADIVWCTTRADESILEKEIGKFESSIIPTIHLPRPRGHPASKRHGLLFVGNLYHRPNRDGLLFFLENVMPILHPGTELTIIGDGADEEILAFRSSGVDVCGWVDDVQPYTDKARVFVAPLRYGAGIKGKIGEAMASGLPVVTTTIGAEGMDLVHGKNVLIADEPDKLAAAVRSLLDNGDLWKRISDAGVEHVARNYSPDIVAKRISGSLD
jgi:GT2 family glycosyltransferase/glycosyltransferase involved in cell wall biosynthesis